MTAQKLLSQMIGEPRIFYLGRRKTAKKEKVWKKRGYDLLDARGSLTYEQARERKIF